MDKDKIIEFIENYGQALSVGDIEELTKYWDIPAVGVCDQGVVRIAHSDDVRRMYTRAFADANQRVRPAPAKPTIEKAEIMSENLIAVSVLWTTPDASGNGQTGSHSRYLLWQGVDGNLRIRAAARRAD